MRIGIFTECYHPTLNGVVVSIDTFCEELEHRGHEFFIFTSKSYGYRDPNPTRVFRLPSIPTMVKDYPLALPFLAPLTIDRVRDLRLDIIHTQHLFMMGRLGLNIGRALQIPVVHTYHTLITEYTHYVPIFHALAKKAVIGISRSYCNQCNQVVTPSASMKKVLRSYGINVPIEIIPTGVKTNDFDHPFDPRIIRAKWQIPEHQQILLYVSRIAKEKNLDFLFEAVRRLSRKRNDLHLLMVGGGPELKHYQKKVAQWNLSGQVTFTGKQEKSQANRFFGAADIFVFPSITETQGIVITEAMTAGLPTVAVGIMGPKDIITNGVNGFLTPLKISEFTDKIEKLLENKALRDEIGKRAHQKAQEFSAKNCALKMEQLYVKTISDYSQ